MDTNRRSLVEIHVAVLLFGAAGLFGKLLTLPPILIVLGRVFFAALFLGGVVRFTGRDIRLRSWRDRVGLAAAGLVLAVHWVTFFQAIKVSTVAVGLLTFSTFPAFAAIIEPFVFQERHRLAELLAAMSTVAGVALIVPAFSLSDNITQGAMWGMLSGFTFAVLSIINRSYVRTYSSLTVTFYQQAIATIVLLPGLFLPVAAVSPATIGLLVLLGVVFTGISHSLFVNSLKNITARTAGIIAGLEPVYGIILAAALLGELPSLRTIAGGTIILIAAFYVTVKAR